MLVCLRVGRAVECRIAAHETRCPPSLFAQCRAAADRDDRDAELGRDARDTERESRGDGEFDDGFVSLHREGCLHLRSERTVYDGFTALVAVRERAASRVPSPPSAIGTTAVSAPGRASRIPVATHRAASPALREPLNLSGVMTMRTRSPSRPEFIRFSLSTD
jgi:hypothetical protein